MASIYAIRCTETAKNYVGCTKSVSKRFREHRCLLKQGAHASPSLQADWNRYGEQAFHIITIQELPLDATVEQKRKAELLWMDHFKKAGTLYNEMQISFQGPPGSLEKAVEASRHVIGNRWTPEANRKRSEAQLGKPKGHGAKISATKRAKKLVMR